MSVLFQPISRPRTIDEFYAALSSGLVIDTLGDACFSIECEKCQRNHLNAEPCAAEVECPDCGSRRGRCIRGSGHEAAEWHKARWDRHAEICEAWETQGRRVVRQWAPTTGTSVELFDWDAL